MATTVTSPTTTTSSTGYATQGTISFDGLATGINTTDTVDKLMAVEGRAKTLKEAEQQRLENQRSTWQDINTKLLDVRTKAQDLTKAATWNTLSAKSTDETVLTAATSSSARAGTYTFKVAKLAQNQQIAYKGFSSALSTVGTGTIAIGAGGASKTLTIDNSNNTLSGLAQAINDAGVGVSASVVNDGTQGAGYRLLLSSDKTGTGNEISVSTSLDLGDQTVVQDAQQAELQFGNLTIHSDSNTVTGVIDGVTLNLLSAKPDNQITLNLNQDTSTVEKSLQALVDSYNTAMGVIKKQFAFDTTTQTGGILMGDSNLVSIQNRLQNLIASSVGTGTKYQSLRSIGLTTADDGTLSLDTARFEQAMAADPTAGQKLFQTTGRSDNAKVSFVYAGSKAVEAPKGYAVHITRAAQQAVATAGSAVASLTVDSTNDTLDLALNNGGTLSVKLDQKTYASAAELASALQDKINTASASGPQVTVTADQSGVLSITSAQYGSAAKLVLEGGTALGNLGFTAAQSATGVDVAGTINGEEATGSGQGLQGNTGNAKTAGLSLQIQMQPSDVDSIAGADVTIYFTKGIASKFNEYLLGLTEPLIGKIDQTTSGLDDSIKTVTDTIADMQKQLDAKRASLLLQFQQMESAVSSLNSQGSYLTNALAALTKSTS